MNAARSFGRFDAVILAATSKLRQVWLSAIAMLVSAVLSLPSALAAPGDVDTLNLNIVGSFVYASAVQPDGKTIIGGQFTSVLGQARNNIARLNADGTLDAGFNPNANSSVESIALQADGQILLGGTFTTVGGIARNRIARVAANGTLDAGFSPNANGLVRSIAVQADGQILLGGDFTTVGGVTRNRIARLAANGTLDAGFNPSANATVYSIAIQADGQVLLGGSFITIGGSTRNRIARVAANGTLDASFTPNANFDVISIAVQADGQILFVGFFTLVNGVTRDRIARVAANGTLDMGFNPVPNSNVFSIALQADGRILFGGEFTSVGGTPRNRIARVAADGMLDLGFNPNVNGDVRNITLQANGQILLGDVFTTVGGLPRNRFARLLNDPATQSLNALDSTQVLWTRGGSAPELGQATFELSTNGGVSYTPLGGTAMRVGSTANWQLTGLSLPANGQVRARGRTAGGFGNGSSGLVEQVASYTLPAPTVTNISPSSGGIAGGTSVTITGTNFIGATAVTVGGVAATGVVVVNANSITATTGARAAGLVSVDVTTPDGTNTPNTLYTYVAPPTVSLATANLPSSATIMVINGTGFSTTPANNTVVFTPSGSGTVTGASATSLTVTGLSGLTLGALNAVVTSDGLNSGTAVQVATVVVPGPGDADALNLNIVGSFVYASAVQPDGKTIIGGQFTSVLGQARNNIARLNADGTLDAGFNPNANGQVISIVVQADGQILLGGGFTTVGGSTRIGIARVAANGALDAGFNPNANNVVYSIAVQADGQILLGGDFTIVGGITRNRIARLAANGTLDAGFDPNANATVYSIAVQADGQILLGGGFTTVGGSTRIGIARVAANGTLDAGFNPNANGFVSSVAVQADGQILLGGFFTTVGGSTRNRIARVAANGTLDAGFDPNADAGVLSIAVQADGQILLGGSFSTIGGSTRNGIARVAASGTLDAGFNPNANGFVRSIAPQANGQILLGGDFNAVGGSPRNRFARLLNDPATQSLTATNATQVLWTRGGSAPDVSQTTFELSTNGGVSYTPLGGTAMRVGSTANWQLSGLSLPASGQLRARGRTTGGYFNGSAGIVEQVAVFSLADITSNLQARYACDGNALDSSGGLRHLGPSFGALSFAVDGRYGRACQFDGFTRVKSANSAFTQSNAVTYAYWIKKTTPRTGQETIMQTVTGAGTSNVQNSIDFETSPARQRIWSNNATFPFTISTVPGPTLFDSTWHHVAITSTGPSSSVQIYIDGAAVMPVTLMGSNSVADLATTFYLGARSDLLSNDLAVYQGAMDDVRIYSRVLTPFDILDLAAPPGIGDVIDTTINEDASTGALNFSVNDLQTPASSLQVVASSSNPSLVPQPNITLGGSGNTRTVSVLPALNQSGTSIITLAVTDADFRTSNINFVLTVDPVNDAPSFVAGANQTVLEDAGPQSIPGWATAVDDGDPESVQALNFVVTPISGTVNFSVFPTISPSGTLSYTSAPDSIGSASFSVRLDDNGGTANGGVDQSADQTFTISVGPVNDAPTFTAGTNQSVLEDAGPQSIPNWATALDDGDPESLQSLNFFVTPISGTVNFSVFPTISPSGTLSYSSAPDSVGSASFSVRLDDNGGTANGGVDQSADQTFTISVGPVNDAPTVTAISNLNINEDTTSAPIAFTINDAETAPGALGLVAGSDNPTLFPGGNIVFGGSGANRTITITPAPNEFGVANFQVIVDDGQASSTSNFVVTVNAVNDAPTVTAISNLSTPEDNATAPIAITLGDLDSPVASLTLSATSSNPSLVPVGNVVFGGTGANRTAVITPEPNQSGTATITVTVSDGSDTTSQSFTLTVTSVNDAPTIAALSNLSTPEDNATAPIAITLGDLDNPVASLTLSATSSNPSLVPVGNVVFGGTGANRTAVITPEPNQSGTATITVTVSDGSDTTSQSFTLTVTSVNDAPTIAALSNLSTPEDNATAPIAITLGDLDNPVASLTLSATSSNPSLVPVGNVVFGGTGANRTAVITPEPNQSGTATITVTVSDGSDTTSQSFTLTVTSVNDAPTIAALSNLSTPEDNATAPIAITLGDLDNPVASLTLSATSSNPSLVPVGNVVFGGAGANRTAVITPAPDQSGTATITVTVSDGSDTTSQSFTLTVTSVNDAPTIAALSNLSTPEDNATAPIAITLGDLDNPVASLTLSATSSNPSLVPVGNVVFGGTGANRTAVITPEPNQSGTATITVTVSDGSDTTSQSFTLTVTSVNDAPTIAALSNLSTPEDNATAPIAITLGDLDNPVASLTLSATSSNPSLVPVGNVVFGGAGANRTAVITPEPNQSGTATITVTVSDGTDTSARTFTLTVNPVNDLPSFTAGPNQSLLFATNTAQTISNWATAITDGDPDFVQGLSFNVSNSNNALFSVQPSIAVNGTLSYTTTGASGTAIVSVSLTDDATAGGPALSTATITFSITVAINTPPSLSAVSAQSTNEDTTTVAIAFTVSDIETPVNALVVTALSSNTSLIPLANIVFAGTGSNRSLSITPTANRSGTSTITLNLSDGTDSSSRSFVLTVNPINDLPSFIKGANQVIAPGITGVQSISNWASAIDDGDADFTQALSFNLSSDNPSLFASQPSVSATGTLSFTPAGIAGIATVSISLTDDASAGGSALTTVAQSFTITIQAVPVVSVEQRSPTSTVVGQPFTVRVRVRNPTGSLAPTGTVSVTPLPVGITVQCSLTAVATPPGSAEALCTNVISPIAAAKLVLAVYEGNPVFLAADASDTHTVDKAATLLRILEDLPDPSPSNTPVAVRYQLEVLAPSVAPLSSLNGIITLSDGSNQTSAPFSLSNPVISLVLQGNGPRVLTLRYSSDSNFLDSSATETHTLTGGNSTDLAVTVSNGKRYVQSGGEAIYLISVRNLGGINSSAQLNAFVPAGLSNYRYTCTASAGSSCHAASGTGAIIAAINVAAGGEVTYTVRADVVATEPANITHSALIVPAAAPPDTNPSNDVASDTDFVGLYSDGFEN